ncbi:MAG: hypothetical protein M1296_04800 [Chloroflexi bacterium]|nr:hypothetical protein [Chloroflexota bacterium]
MDDLSLIDQWLPVEGQVLFWRQSRYDQAHAISHLRELLHLHPEAPLEMIHAMLLHDVGKAAYRIPPLYRVVHVLLGRAPHVYRALLHRWKQKQLLFPLIVLQEHSRIGAEWAAAAGLSERTVYLIAHHHDENARDVELQWLQRVDDL